MRKKLPGLKKEINKRSIKSNREYHSYGQKYFDLIIIPRYLTNQNRYQSDFCKMTGLSKDVYRELRGGGNKLKVKNERTLLKVAFGLGITYEEAFYLFDFFGKNLYTDDPAIEAIDSILDELDNLPNDLSPEMRIVIMGDYLKEKGLII